MFGEHQSHLINTQPSIAQDLLVNFRKLDPLVMGERTWGMTCVTLLGTDRVHTAPDQAVDK